jgi:hypothetical protein
MFMPAVSVYGRKQLNNSGNIHVAERSGPHHRPGLRTGHRPPFLPAGQRQVRRLRQQLLRLCFAAGADQVRGAALDLRLLPAGVALLPSGTEPPKI